MNKNAGRASKVHSYLNDNVHSVLDDDLSDFTSRLVEDKAEVVLGHTG